MLSLEAAQQVIKEKKRSAHLKRNDRVYYEMSLHIDGACPAFHDVRLDRMIYPTNYFCAEHQLIFETSLFTKFPFESDQTRNYRLAQYRPYQQEPFLKAIQVIIGAIFQDGNYAIEIESNEDEQYIWGENFDGKHLVGYLSKHFQNICNDPNGYFVVIPKYSRLEAKGKVEPVLWFVPSTKIQYVSSEELIFEKDGFYWLVNSIGYFRFRENENREIELLDEGGYYAHMLGRMPCYIAGGIWNTQGFYNSWLYAAKAIADEFVGEKSLSQFVNKQNAHPFYIAANEDCTDCSNGKIQYCKKCHTDSEGCNCGEDGNWSLANCSTCHGTGVKPHDPAAWMRVEGEMMKDDQIKIISANTDIPRVQFENVKDVEKRIMRSLHLNYIEEAQSGAAKDKDMETRYQFLSLIANSLCDEHLYNWIKDITALRNVSVRNGVVVPAESKFSIVKPTQFAIMTAAEIKEEIGEEMPDYVKAKQIEDYVDKKFGGDEILKRKTTLIVQLDKISMTTQGKVQSLLLNGGIQRKDLQFHVELPLILDRIEREKGAKWLLQSEYEAIKQEVDRIFAEITPLDPLAIDNVRNLGMGLDGDTAL